MTRAYSACSLNVSRNNLMNIHVEGISDVLTCVENPVIVLTHTSTLSAILAKWFSFPRFSKVIPRCCYHYALFTAMRSTRGLAIIDISFCISMRFHKPMITIGGENYTLVVGYKKSLHALTSWAIRVTKALLCFFLNFRDIQECRKGTF